MSVNFHLADLKFKLSLNPQDESAKEELMKIVTENNMTSYYLMITEEFKHWIRDETLIGKMKNENTEKLDGLKEKLAEKEANFGETEVAEVLVETADYLTKIGEKEKAIEAYNTAFDKTAGNGAKIDLIFNQICIGLFYCDHEIIGKYLEKGKKFVEEGGDWDRRNRFKVFEGIYLISIRDFKKASPLLIDGLATFSSNELMSYKDFVKYVTLTGIVTLKRPDLKSKILESPEVLEVIHEIPYLKDFVSSLYNCKYSDFFKCLAHIETYLKNDRYLHAHCHWYVREMRISAYSQFLDSYRSVTLDSMAKSFGVSVSFIDRDLSKFIASDKLRCTVDKVMGVVETNRADTKNNDYQKCIKQGDALLNRIQKLAKVINV